MTEPLIVVFPRGQLSELDKARLEERDIVAIEADDPSAVQQLRIARPMLCEALKGDAIVAAALRAIAGRPAETNSGSITHAGRVAHDFVKALSGAIQPSGARHGE